MPPIVAPIAAPGPAPTPANNNPAVPPAIAPPAAPAPPAANALRKGSEPCFSRSCAWAINVSAFAPIWSIAAFSLPKDSLIFPASP